MVCRRCRTPNPEGAVYCAGCGRPLLRKRESWLKSLRPFLFVAAAAVALVILYFLYRHIASGPKAGPARGAETADAAFIRPAQPAEGFLLPTFGEVVVRGDAGREVFRTTAAIFKGAWLALPVSALMGGKELTFQADRSDAVGISEGTWAVGDPVVFWKFDSGNPPAAPDLAAWRPSLPLDWRPFRSTSPPFRVEVSASRRAGAFASFPRPPEIRSPGVFLQEGAIVGWTFGDPFDQAYLWEGAPAAGPPPAIRVDQFLAAVSDSREGYFRRLLDSGAETTPAAELEALAKGFRLAPLLSPEDVPPHLRQSSIVGRMDSIASDLIQNGQGDEVARILNDPIIRESADPVLAKDAVLALASDQDYNRAIRRLETIEREIFVARGAAPAELTELKSRLYKDWLRKIIEKGDYYSGATAFEEAQRAFPEDLEIRLLGVETAIAEKNYARAREILEAREYPPALKEWAARLATQVNARQEEAEAIVIHFNPGVEYIPVDAVLNGFHLHKFLVDTGASTVTIPTGSLDILRIKVDDSTPVRAVSTASGVVMAREVTLDSIRLEQTTVYNVPALVMDIPGFPDYGVLGLSYLNNFSVEIDKPNGILRLKKR